MTSLNLALKSEIARVARKELKDELTVLRKVTASHRSEIAALKRDVKALHSRLKANERALKKVMPISKSEPQENRSPVGSFNAAVFAAKRAKLGLTQSQMAQLLEASALSVTTSGVSAGAPISSRTAASFSALRPPMAQRSPWPLG